jgi:beta-mannosidase
MTTHAETLRAEAEYARFNKGRTWGFMNWMFSDIWPSGTWSIVDYYGEPKQAYYQLKRSYEPKLLTFVQANDGKTYLSLINDTKDAVNTVIEYGLKTLNGEIVWSDEASVSLDAFDTYKLEVEKEFKISSYTPEVNEFFKAGNGEWWWHRVFIFSDDGSGIIYFERCPLLS